MKIDVTKKINFVMGHRVYTQNLPGFLGINKCRHLHGHEYVLEVFLTSEVSDDGMVIDFTYFNIINSIVQKYFDHHFMLSVDDPLFQKITQSDIDTKIICYKPLIDGSCQTVETTIREFKLHVLDGFRFASFIPIDDEFRDSFIIVDFVPTAENLSVFFKNLVTWLIEQNEEKLSRTSVSKIRLYETQKAYVEISF